MKQNKPFNPMPMAVQDIDKDGNIWFLYRSGTQKKGALVDDSFVQLLFHGRAFSDFLSLFGSIRISRDKNKIKELWKLRNKHEFPEGIKDPRLRVIQFQPVEGHYWNTRLKKVVALPETDAEARPRKPLRDIVEKKFRTG